MNPQIQSDHGRPRGSLKSNRQRTAPGRSFASEALIVMRRSCKPENGDHDPALAPVMNHLINAYKKCPVCGLTDRFEVRDYDELWHDGEVWCVLAAKFSCGTTMPVKLIRMSSRSVIDRQRVRFSQPAPQFYGW